MAVTGLVFVLSVVVGLLLAETRLSMRNEATLRGLGAVAPPGDVYRALAFIYPAGFLLMGAEGIWRASRVAVEHGDGPAWWVAGLLLLVASKGLKYWAIANLGERWTFKILVLPGLALVRTGPYQYVDHPNYIAVFGELVGMALLAHAWVSGPLAVLAFALALRIRLRVEIRALQAPDSAQNGKLV